MRGCYLPPLLIESPPKERRLLIRRAVCRPLHRAWLRTPEHTCHLLVREVDTTCDFISADFFKNCGSFGQYSLFCRGGRSAHDPLCDRAPMSDVYCPQSPVLCQYHMRLRVQVRCPGLFRVIQALRQPCRMLHGCPGPPTSHDVRPFLLFCPEYSRDVNSCFTCAIM